VTTTLVIAFALLAAAFAIGLTGYGFGLVAMGILPYAMTVADSNALVAVLGLVVILIAFVPRVREVRVRILLPLLIGALAGVPLGVFVLVRLDERLLRVLLGAAILLALAGSLYGSRRAARGGVADQTGDESADPGALPRDGTGRVPTRERRGRRGAGALLVALIGVVSGSFGGAFSVSGPPVVIYFNEIFSDKSAIKAHLVAYFSFIMALRMPFLFAAGVYDRALLEMILFGLPVVLIGLWIGTRLHDRLPSAVVRRIIQVLLAVSATLLIAGA